MTPPSAIIESRERINTPFGMPYKHNGQISNAKSHTGGIMFKCFTTAFPVVMFHS